MSSRKEIDTVKLGEKIKKLRKDKGLMQYELADIVGVTPLTMIRIEFGRTVPTLETIKGIAKALNVKIDELIGG